MKIITVDIKNIKVFPDDEYFGNYSYDWEITVDGKLYSKDTYESDIDISGIYNTREQFNRIRREIDFINSNK